MHDRIFLPHWASSSTTLSINKFVVQRKVISKEHLNIILFLSRFSIHKFLRARTFDQKYFPGWGEALFFVSQTANSNSPLMAWFWRGWGLGAWGLGLTLTGVSITSAFTLSLSGYVLTLCFGDDHRTRMHSKGKGKIRRFVSLKLQFLQTFLQE